MQYPKHTAHKISVDIAKNKQNKNNSYNDYHKISTLNLKNIPITFSTTRNSVLKNLKAL